jgi:hypothetical protein
MYDSFINEVERYRWQCQNLARHVSVRSTSRYNFHIQNTRNTTSRFHLQSIRNAEQMRAETNKARRYRKFREKQRLQFQSSKAGRKALAKAEEEATRNELRRYGTVGGFYRPGRPNNAPPIRGFGRLPGSGWAGRGRR